MNADHPCHGTGVDPESRVYTLTAGDRANATAWKQEDQGGQPPPGGARPRAKGDPAKRLSESVPKPALRHPWPDPAAPGRGRHAAGVPRSGRGAAATRRQRRPHRVPPARGRRRQPDRAARRQRRAQPARLNPRSSTGCSPAMDLEDPSQAKAASFILDQAADIDRSISPIRANEHAAAIRRAHQAWSGRA
jgi:hypothetical protein